MVVEVKRVAEECMVAEAEEWQRKAEVIVVEGCWITEAEVVAVRCRAILEAEAKCKAKAKQRVEKTVGNELKYSATCRGSLAIRSKIQAPQ